MAQMCGFKVEYGTSFRSEAHMFLVNFRLYNLAFWLKLIEYSY